MVAVDRRQMFCGKTSARAFELRLKPCVLCCSSVHLIIAQSDPLRTRVVCSGGKQSLHLHLLPFLSKPQRNCKEKEANLTNTVCNVPVTTFSKCLEVVCEIVASKENSLFFIFPCESFDLLFLPGLTIKLVGPRKRCESLVNTCK